MAGGVGGINGDKRIPESFLMASQAVIDGLMASDGCLGRFFTTTSQQVADMLQTLGAISGQLFSQSIRQTCYRLYRVRRCHYPHVNDARGSQTQLVDEPYRGLVYQLTTQTGVVLAQMGTHTVLLGSELFPD